ncbi:MAG: glycerol-3-phosphate dehydrogenase/oxidase [Candidatus Methanofastidiosia archaeon]
MDFSFKTRKKNIKKMRREEFDVLVIGGGITGAGIARDATFRGLRTALVEKGDFASGTSSNSSKLIHGGFRYLETMELLLVFEASTERDRLRKLAPLSIRPSPFIMPIYRYSRNSYFKISCGMWLYDLLSLFKNIKRHRMFRAKKILEFIPELDDKELVGGVFYYDCVTDDWRLTMRILKSAHENGAILTNYTKLEDFLKDNGRICGAKVRDLISGEDFEVKAKLFVNATGPWTDEILRLDEPGDMKIRPTKGIHIILPKDRFESENTVVVSDHKGERFIFVIPWNDFCIVGTTDTDFSESLDELYAKREEVLYLLESLNKAFPKLALSEKDVISTYAGVRPLILQKEKWEYRVSREHKVFESKSGLITITGGKLTTFRKMSEEVVDKIASKLERDFGIKPDSCKTHKIPLEDVDFKRVAFYLQDKVEEAREYGLSREVAYHLISTYGEEHREILEFLNERGRERIVEDLPHIKAEIPFSIKKEMTLTLNDFLVRRTRIFLKDLNQGLTCARDVAEMMAEYLSWSKEEIERQVKLYEREVELSRRFREIS